MKVRGDDIPRYWDRRGLHSSLDEAGDQYSPASFPLDHCHVVLGVLWDQHADKLHGGGCLCEYNLALGIPLWDRHVSAETNVEDTLWLCLAVLIAVVVTAAVELVFVRQRPGDEILLPMTDRLSAVEDVLSCYAEGRAPDAATQREYYGSRCWEHPRCGERYGAHNVPPQYSAAAGGVAVLIGRLVDLAATLTPLSFEFSADNRMRFRNLASTLASIRNDLMNREIPAPVQFNAEAELRRCGSIARRDGAYS